MTAISRCLRSPGDATTGYQPHNKSPRTRRVRSPQPRSSLLNLAPQPRASLLAPRSSLLVPRSSLLAPRCRARARVRLPLRALLPLSRWRGSQRIRGVEACRHELRRRALPRPTLPASAPAMACSASRPRACKATIGDGISNAPSAASRPKTTCNRSRSGLHHRKHRGEKNFRRRPIYRTYIVAGAATGRRMKTGGSDPGRTKTAKTSR